MKKANLFIRKLLLKDWLYYSLFLISIVYAGIYLNIKKESVYSEEMTHFRGVIESFEIRGDKLTFVVKAKEKLKGNYYFEDENEKEKTLSNLKLGMTIDFYGTLTIPDHNTIPNNFDYKSYLYNNGIFYICQVKKFEIGENKIDFLYMVKNSVIKRINSFYRIGDYLLTFIIGDKSMLDANTYETYRVNGVTHLFAISGMHIGLFAVVLLKFWKLCHIGEEKGYLLTVAFIWFYAFLTAFTPSVLRAGMLFTLLSLNKIFYTEVKSLNCLLLSGAMLIGIQPYLLKDIGFIYSFSTTFGLMYAGKTLSKHKILGTSIIAFLASLPITINNFYSVNFLSIILNIVFVPYVSLIVYPLCLLTFFLKILEPLTEVFLRVMEIFSLLTSRIDICQVNIPKMPVTLIVAYYLIFAIFINKNFKLCLSFLALTILIDFVLVRINPNFSVEFLDVGQGDSILMRSPHNRETVLIDTGGKLAYQKDDWRKKENYNVSDKTLTYLESIGITKLNYLVLTHGDADHMGEAINIVENFKVKSVVFNCGPYNELEKNLIRVLNDRKIEYRQCIDEISIGDTKLYFLQTEKYDNENDNSNVIYAELNRYKFLFMGDVSSTTEKKILAKYSLPNIDILKVGHHGSKTSSSSDFINEIEPKYSIISVGKNNRYGHPNKETLDNLNNSKIYRTDVDGSVMFEIKKSRLNIKTCPP